MHSTLEALYEQMMPLCAGMCGVARALAGLGALIYISLRIWRTLADGERIELLPLLRPFGIGLLIAFFPTLVLGTMNGILGTITRGTESMLEKETFSMAEFRKAQEAAEKKRFAEDPETAYMESDEAFDRELESLGWSPTDLAHMTNMFYQRTMYGFQKWIREVITNVMQLLFESSALIIDAIRTFYLIVLSILGPISFSLSVWNGLESTMGHWISRYIQVYLWLPVSNLFSCILLKLQSLMLQNSMTDGEGSWVYLLFMAVGTVGYFCVPTVSEWIVQAGGTGAYGRAVNSAASYVAGMSAKTIPAVGRGIRTALGGKRK